MKDIDPAIINLIGNHLDFIETNQDLYHYYVKTINKMVADFDEISTADSHPFLYETINENDESTYSFYVPQEAYENKERAPTQIARVERWISKAAKGRRVKVFAFSIKPDGKDEKPSYFISKEAKDFFKVRYDLFY